MICGLSRTGREDVLRAADALKAAKRRRIHVFIVHQPAAHEIQAAHGAGGGAGGRRRPRSPWRANYTDDVEWSAEDGTRTEPDFLCRCVEAAIKAGATTINIPDTVGYALPEDMERIFTMIRERVPGADKVILSTHNHNDLGLAVANTLAAVRAGVRQVESTINGIGERAGNASLEEAVMAIRTRHDAIPYKNNIKTAEHPARVEAAVHHHRVRRAAEQGDRRPQRLRA